MLLIFLLYFEDAVENAPYILAALIIAWPFPIIAGPFLDL